MKKCLSRSKMASDQSPSTLMGTDVIRNGQ
jgi:hypothetical protein